MKALNDEQRAYIAGHGGMVGAAILRRLKTDDLADLLTRTHRELDLTDVAAVDACFATERPTRVYLAAAKVGGIWANDRYPAEFIYQNLMTEANVIHVPRFLAGAQLRCRVSRGLDRSYAQLFVGPSKTTVGPN